MKLSQTIAASCAKDMAERPARPTREDRLELIRRQHKILQKAGVVGLDLDDDGDDGFDTEDGDET